ncbi:MAG: methyltransferase domain-containing protein [Gammaproteobacteria bacterium]|nr:methyltransferase domain-containing protein [Gammaproteobacteria bacterium]
MPLLPARLSQAEVVSAYRRIAPLYDRWAYLTESRARRRAVELAAVRAGESLLEVAVGTGLLFRDLVARNPDGRNAGVDLTPAMLERARRRVHGMPARNVELRQGDAFALPYADGAFDLLVNAYMFDLLPEGDFVRVLAEFRRVLKPGGRLVLTNMAQAERLGERFYETIYRLNPAWMGGCRGVALAGPVAAAGFTGVRRERLSQMGFPSEIITAVK